MKRVPETIAAGFILGFASSLAEASQVLQVFNQELVLVDAGNSQGYQKQEELCFQAKDGSRLGCGYIEIVEKDRSYVKVEAALARRLYRGIKASTRAEEAQLLAKKAEEEALKAAKKAEEDALKIAREMEIAKQKAAVLSLAANNAQAQVEALQSKLEATRALTKDSSMHMAAKNPPAPPPATAAPAAPVPTPTPPPLPPAAAAAPEPAAPAPEAVAAEPAPAAPEPSPAPQAETQTVTAPSPAASPAPAAPATAEAGAHTAEFRYLYTLQAPAYFKAISYFSPYDKLGTPEDVSTLWEQKQIVASSRIGFSLSYARPLGSALLSFGGRFRDYGSFDYTADYEADEDIDAVTSLSATAFGGFVDYYFFFNKLGIFDAKIGGGLDFDYSQVSLKMKRKTEDTSSMLYNYLSTLNVLAARLPIDCSYSFEGFKAHIGGIFIIPFLSSSSYSANVKDQQAKDNLKDGNGKEDTDTAVAHQASPVAFELMIGASKSF